VSIQIHQKLNDLNFETLNQPFYPPDLSLTDLYLSKHLDIFVRDKVFKKQIDTQEALDEFINFKNQTSINLD